MRIILLLFLVIVNLYGLDRGLRKVFETEPKIALLVGNSKYSKSNNFDSLKNPVNDIQAVSQKLKELGFRVIEGYNLSDIKLQEKVDQFLSLLKSNRDGVGLFYFAGHGIEVNGVNYLVPSDISVNDIKYIPYRSTPLNPIIEQMNETGKRLNIAILDACRENPFTSTRNKKRGGLASFSASGTFIAYSAESGKLASDGDGELSPFAEAFIKEMDKPQTIERVFKNVRVDVSEKTDGKQTPATYSLIKGDFYFKLPKGDFSTSPNSYGQNKNPTITSSKVERSQKHRLYVLPTPKDAKVRILNIRPKYFDGIDLERDKALIEVTADGYKKYLKWHYNLKDEAVISIELERERLAKLEAEQIVMQNRTVKAISKWSDEFGLGLPKTWEELSKVEGIVAQGRYSYTKNEENKGENLDFYYFANTENKRVTYIPSEIGNLSNLQYLDLGSNKLRSIPSEIGNLSNLQILFLNTNELRSLPSEIGNLFNLQILDLRFNDLRSIPSEIGNLSNLQTLWLMNNKLRSLPNEIGNLSNLQILYLYDNQLRSIPSEIGNLSNLQILDLSANRLTSLPSSVNRLTKLKQRDPQKESPLQFLNRKLGLPK